MEYSPISKKDALCVNCRSEQNAHNNGACAKTPHEIGREYGFRVRSSLDGYFLSEDAPYKFCPWAAGDDLIKVENNGMIRLLVTDGPGMSQAYLCAIALKHSL